MTAPVLLPEDMAHCRAMIRTGSLSFHAASKLLPARVRDPALVLYAFCRLADDAVDLHVEKAEAVLRLRDRLDRIYRGTPLDRPVDRAFHAVIEAHGMPRALPDALLEGLAWDATGRRYATLSEVRAYSARVASAVGAMMCVLMGVRDRNALARACDMGVAMQLTNIARDVGEDARAGRIYLPTNWFARDGMDVEAYLAAPDHDARVAEMVRQLLREAERLYLRAEPGIARLPVAVRPGIFAARHIYAGIGSQVRRNGYDSFHYRATTGKAQKLGWLALSAARTAAGLAMPHSAVLYAEPLDETRYLVDAAARHAETRGIWGDGRSGALIEVLAQLEARDRDQGEMDVSATGAT